MHICNLFFIIHNDNDITYENEVFSMILFIDIIYSNHCEHDLIIVVVNKNVIYCYVYIIYIILTANFIQSFRLKSSRNSKSYFFFKVKYNSNVSKSMLRLHI